MRGRSSTWYTLCYFDCSLTDKEEGVATSTLANYVCTSWIELLRVFIRNKEELKWISENYQKVLWDVVVFKIQWSSLLALNKLFLTTNLSRPMKFSSSTIGIKSANKLELPMFCSYIYRKIINSNLGIHKGMKKSIQVKNCIFFLSFSIYSLTVSPITCIIFPYHCFCN